MTKIYITEHRQGSEMLAKALDEGGICSDALFFSAIPIYLNRARYPRRLNLAEYPHFSTPVFKNSGSYEPNQNCMREWKDGKLVKTQISGHVAVRKALLEASEIICACDWDYRGAWGFDRFIEYFLGDARAAEYPLLKFLHCQPTQLLKLALNLSTTADPEYQDLLNAGKTKRLFDYNFDANSLAVLGSHYRRVSGGRDPAHISKFALQILYWLRGQGWVSHYRANNGIHAGKWKGTGKYAINSNMHLEGVCSPASRSTILQDLCDLELLEEKESTGYRVSSFGHLFLEGLHKDCEDSDLPFRLDRWMQQGLQLSEPAIRKYIRTFFGKQLKHQSLTTNQGITK